MDTAQLAPSAQTSPDLQFTDWMGGHDAALALFLRSDAPAVAALADPWTFEGLVLAVSTARTLLPDHRAVIAPENRATVERFGRFVGEVFVRSFDGHWCNVPDNAPVGVQLWPMIRCAGYPAPLGPRSELELAVVEGRCKELAATANGLLVNLFTQVQERHRQWMETERQSAAPPPEQLAG
ncbi:hypothetical protein [Nocardia stercoris]|uniref:Uncharacterized protein n=1 Tax=Nocardia stercoris TaxID=2483361 RepID=A0A3M2KZ10_9NOCA|nr:hypothetical protein [Nocardia stercoris]RMI30354.1 hypothetical protein EBN03_22170 [Nocardia stercoris]